MTGEHVHPEFRAVLSHSAEDRIEFIRQARWIGYAGADRITATLRGLMDTPKRARMPCLLVVGDSNNGKTSIIRRFNGLHGLSYIDEDGDSIRPIVLAEAPPGADVKGLYLAILQQFIVPYRASAPAYILREQVLHLMRTYHVRILLIDEFHSLTSGPAIRQREVMNAIKHLCNELQMPIVGIGTAEAVPVLHQDHQHASRFDVRTLPLWNLDREFQNRLRGIEQVLPLIHPSNLRDIATGTALHSLSGGNLGNLQNIIVECGIEAIQSGRERIDLEMIQSKAWMGKKIRMANV